MSPKVNRRKFVSLVGAALLSYLAVVIRQSFAKSNGFVGGDSSQERKLLVSRKRRIIQNNDGNELRSLHGISTITPEIFLGQRVAKLIGTHVDTICYCDGVFNLYTHRSELTEFKTSGETGYLYKQLVEEFDTDPLELVLQWGKENAKEVFWSMRMNDTHDSYDSGLLSNWKEENGNLLMGRKGERFPYGEHRWSALDYGHIPVRTRIIAIIADVIDNYDVDGIELDFFRHPLYFKQQLFGQEVTQKQCDIITDLISEIRRMLIRKGEKRGRPVLLSARVPDSIPFSRAIGLDLSRWLESRLLDFSVMGGYFRFHNWKHSVQLGKEYNIPIYACLETGRIQAKARGERALEKWRSEAMQAWEAGVDGIYTFNAFNPTASLFKELGDSELLQTLKRSKPLSGLNPHLWTRPERWLKNGNMYVEVK